VTPVDPLTTPNELRYVGVSHPFGTGINVHPGTEDVQVLRVQVNMKGSLNAQDITEMVFGTKGTTTNQVIAAHLYYTGANGVFNANTHLGTLTTPSGTNT